MINWKVVEKDGNPTEPGTYFVILIYCVYENGQPTGERVAELSSRYFADLDANPHLVGWEMEDQPDHGLAWTEQTGSILGESVYAWLNLDGVEMPPLPEGMKLWDGD